MDTRRNAQHPALHPAHTAAPTGWLYIRESDPKQLGGHSPETQERLGRDLAAREGVTITRVLWEANSARTARQRKAWQTVLHGIRQHEFDVLLVWKYSRMHRNLMGQLQTFALARAHNVRILAAADPRDEGDKLSKMSIYITGMFNEMESDTIREQSMAGTRSRVLKGMPLVGRVPLYGYRWVTEVTASALTGATRNRKVRLEPDPVTAPRVVAFFTYLDHPDHSLQDAANWLNAQGWPSPSGGVWKKDTLRELVKHGYYRGEPRAYVTELVAVGSDDYEVTKKQRDNAARADAVALPLESVPPLVDAALAQRVRERVQQRAVRRGSPHLLQREHYLLPGGFLRCGHHLPDGSICHGTMGPHKQQGRTDTYVCHRGSAFAASDPRKHYNSIPASVTDRFALASFLMALTLSDDAEAALRHLAQQEDTASEERQLAEHAWRDADTRLERLKRQMEQLDEDEQGEFTERFRQLRHERDNWKQRLTALEGVAQTAERMVATLRRAVDDAHARMWDAGDELEPPWFLTAMLDTQGPLTLAPDQRNEVRELLDSLHIFYEVAPPAAPGRHGPTWGKQPPTERIHAVWPLRLHEQLQEQVAARYAAAAAGQPPASPPAVLEQGDESMRRRMSSRLW